MGSTQDTQTPVGARIIGFDIARALAFFGMVLVNYRIVISGTGDGPGFLATFIGLLEGRAAATFVVLAGVGISLMSRRVREIGDREGLAQKQKVLLRRAIFLFTCGLLYTPLWPADILHFYGLYMVIGACLLGAESRRLWHVTVLLVFGFVLLNFIFDYEAGWDWNTLAYNAFWTPTGLVRHMFFNGFHPVFPWSAFLVAGMWLGRQDFCRSQVRHRLLVGSVITVAVAESISRLFVGRLSAGADAETAELVAAIFGSAPVPPFPFYMIAGTGFAFVVIVICVNVALRIENRRWLTPLVHTGQLALTLYVAHVVIGMGALGLVGRLGDQTLPFALSASLVFCGLAVVCSHLWRQRFSRGPLEWVMRNITA